MIRTSSSKQLTIAEFDWPFETALDKSNRWVKLNDCIPWDELSESYYQGFVSDRGRPMKEARLVIGAVLIGFMNRVKLALKYGGVNPLIYANKKRPVMALSLVSKLSAL
jgi:hypothetical protein